MLNGKKGDMCISSLQTVALLKDFNIFQEAVSSNFINEKNFAHSSVWRQIRTIEPSLVGWGQDYEHLDVLGPLNPDDLLLQVEVLGAIVGEDHDEGALRGVL